jgi:hypothetical protein
MPHPGMDLSTNSADAHPKKTTGPRSSVGLFASGRLDKACRTE